MSQKQQQLESNINTTSLNDRERNRQYDANNDNTNANLVNNITNDDSTTATATTTSNTILQQSMVDINNDQDHDGIMYAKQLFNAYFIITTEFNIKDKDVKEMSKILSKTATSTTTTITSVIKLFMELRERYIGPLNLIGQIGNDLSNDKIFFNHRLFHAALLTNQQTIIDNVIPFLNFDFTTLNIPHDQRDDIRKFNSLDYSHSQRGKHFRNLILVAIVDATKRGHYESITHLINHYQLSPTIPIYDAWNEQDEYYPIQPHDALHVPITDLFYYSTWSTNPKLSEYFLSSSPPAINPTFPLDLIDFATKNGHLNALKQLQQIYNLNLLELSNRHYLQLMLSAIKPNNTNMVDYLVEIGFEPFDNSNDASKAYTCEMLQHLIVKYNAQIVNIDYRIIAGRQDLPCTIDAVDFIIELFHDYFIEGLTLNESKDYPILFVCAQNGHLNILQHLILKYNANPHIRYQRSPDQYEHSLLHSIFMVEQYHAFPSLEMVEYICSLGIDINQKNRERETVLDLTIRKYSCYISSNNTPPAECPLEIFKTLLKHGAIIDDVNNFIVRLAERGHWTTVRYLLETFYTQINIDKISLLDLSLLHLAVDVNPSIDFITYLLSLNVIDINCICSGKTPLYIAMASKSIDINIIKLLVINGATITINHWRNMLFSRVTYTNPFKLFECIDYFKDTYHWDIQTLAPLQLNDKHNNYMIGLLHYGEQNHCKNGSLLSFIINSCGVKYSHKSFIYRTLIYKYKANIHNDILLQLAAKYHVDLIQFTLFNRRQQSILFYQNNNGHSLLHILLSHLVPSTQYDYFSDASLFRPAHGRLNQINNEIDSKEISLINQFEFVMESIVEWFLNDNV